MTGCVPGTAPEFDLTVPKFEAVAMLVVFLSEGLILVFGLMLVSGLASRLFYIETHHRTVAGPGYLRV